MVKIKNQLALYTSKFIPYHNKSVKFIEVITQRETSKVNYELQIIIIDQ